MRAVERGSTDSGETSAGVKQATLVGSAQNKQSDGDLNYTQGQCIPIPAKKPGEGSHS